MLENYIISIIKHVAPVLFKRYLAAFPGGDNIRSLVDFRNFAVKTLNAIGDPKSACDKLNLGLNMYADVRGALIEFGKKGGYRNVESYFASTDGINNQIDRMYNKLRFAVESGAITTEKWETFKEDFVKVLDEEVTAKASHKYLEK